MHDSSVYNTKCTVHPGVVYSPAVQWILLAFYQSPVTNG